MATASVTTAPTTAAADAPTSPTISAASRTLAPSRRTLREHLGEQVRLTFADPADRLIAAQLLALVDAAGRLAMEDAALAAALGCQAARVAAVRARMQRFDPTGMFCRDLRECLAVQLAEQNRFDPAMQALLDNLDLLAKRDRLGLMQVCGVDAEDLAEMIAELRRLDPKPGASFDAAPAPPVVPDLLMRRAPDGELGAGAEPGHPAPRAGEPRLPRPRPARRPFARGPGLPDRAPSERQLADQEPGTAGRDHPEGGRRDRRAGRKASSATVSGICAP